MTPTKTSTLVRDWQYYSTLNLRYKTEIGDIVSCASKELDLEQKLRSTEEEWAEQSLHFSQFKNRGFLMLDAR